jgi:recombination protein RecT
VSDIVKQQPQQVVPQAPKKQDVKALLQGEQFRKSVAAALPKHLTPDRFVRISINATMRNPELLKCTQESFFRCLLELSAYGIEPDGRRAHLIPRNVNVAGKGEQARWEKQCTIIIDYKGLAELVRRSGDVSYIHADVVYEGDQWSFAYGSQAHLMHVPSERPDGARLIAAYSFVKLKDGCEDFIVMFPGEVQKIAERSQSGGKSGPWVSDRDEMVKKTVFRRHSKWLPLSPDVRDAVEKDQEAIDVGDTIADLPHATGDGESIGQLTEAKGEALKEQMREEAVVEAEAATDKKPEAPKAEEPKKPTTRDLF